MAVFGKIDSEPIIQTFDKTRIDVSRSFVSKGEPQIDTVEIEPYAGAGFVDVTGTSQQDWFLDFSYSGTTTRDETITLRITNTNGQHTFTKTIHVITPEDDLLFSNDDELKVHEPNIMNWVVEGRDSFLDVHRMVQQLIVDYFDAKGYRKSDGSKLTKQDLIRFEELRQWAKYWALALIMSSRSNSIDDIFAQKADDYLSRGLSFRDRVFISYDWNSNGAIDPNEENMRSNVIEVNKT